MERLRQSNFDQQGIPAHSRDDSADMHARFDGEDKASRRMLMGGLDKVRRAVFELGQRARRTVLMKESSTEFIGALKPWERQDVEQYIDLSFDRLANQAERAATIEARTFDRTAFLDRLQVTVEFSKDGRDWLRRWHDAQGGKREGIALLYNEMVNNKKFNEFERNVYKAYAQKTILTALRASIEDEFVSDGGKASEMENSLTVYSNDYPFLSKAETAMDPELAGYVVDQNRRLIALQHLFEATETQKNNLEFRAGSNSPANDLAAGKLGYVRLFGIEDVMAKLEHRDGASMPDVLAWRGRGYDRYGTVNGRRTFIVGPSDLFYEDYDPAETRPRVSHVMREAAKKMVLGMHEIGEISWDDEKTYVQMEKGKLISEYSPTINDPIKLRTVYESPGFPAFKQKVIDNGSVNPTAYSTPEAVDKAIAELYVMKMFRFRTAFWAAGDLTQALYPLVARRRSSQSGGWEAPDVFFEHIDRPNVNDPTKARYFTLQDGTNIAVYPTTRGSALKRFQLHPVDVDGKALPVPDYGLLAHFTQADFEMMAREEVLPNPPEVANRLRTLKELNSKIDKIAKNRRITSEEIRAMFINGEGAAVYSQPAERNYVMARLIREIEGMEHAITNSTRDPIGLTTDLPKMIHKGGFMGETAVFVYAAIGRDSAEWHQTPRQWSEIHMGRFDVSETWAYDEWLFNRDPEAYEAFMRTTYSLPEGEEAFVGGVVLELVYGYLFSEFASGQVTMDDYLQFYGMKREREHDADAGVDLVRVKRIEDTDAALFDRISRDPNRGLSSTKARFLRSIHNVNIGAIVQYLGEARQGNYVDDNTSLFTDPLKRSREVAEVFFKYIYGPTAYGGGVLSEFQRAANMRVPLSPISAEVIAISNGRTLNRDRVYRHGEAVPVMDILNGVAEMVYETPLELVPPRDARALLGAEKITVDGNEDYLIPAVRKDYQDPYLVAHGIDRPGFVSYTSLSRRLVPRYEVMPTRDLMRGSMDYLDVPASLDSNIIARQPIQVTSSFMARELLNPILYKGFYSYQNALVIRDCCAEMGIHYNYRKQEELLSQYPLLQAEVDRRWLNENRFARVHNPLDLVRLFSTHKLLPQQFFTDKEVADLLDLTGSWVDLEPVDDAGQMLPVRYQAAYFYQIYTELGLVHKDKEWAEFATKFYKDTKEAALEAVNITLTGFGGSMVPAVVSNTLTKALGRGRAEIVGPALKRGGTYAAVGSLSLGFGALALVPEANIAGVLALGGAVTGLVSGVTQEILNGWQGSNRVAMGVRNIQDGKVNLIQHGTATVLQTRKAFEAGIAVADSSGDAIMQLVTEGKGLNLKAFMNTLYVAPRGELLNIKTGS